MPRLEISSANLAKSNQKTTAYRDIVAERQKAPDKVKYVSTP